MIGAGGQAGQGDAANLLKPALARGELRTIAATTWSEYKKYFEKDPALARRFQLVKVEEPDEEGALDMLRGVAPHLEKHHGVRILDEAVRSAVRSPTATSPSAACPTRPSACSTPPPRAWRSPRRARPPRSRTSTAASASPRPSWTCASARRRRLREGDATASNWN